MKGTALTTGIAVVCSFVLGLGWAWFVNGRTQGVAVVDLDEVARRLGRDEQMVESFQRHAGKLGQALLSAQQSAVSQLEEMRQNLPESPSVEQAQNFAMAKRNAQLQLDQRKKEVDLSLNQHRQQLISRFREDAKPIASRVAREKGFATVVTRNDSVVFSYDQGVDITEDVIKLMSAEAPARQPAARPAEAATSQPAAQTSQQPAEASTR